MPGECLPQYAALAACEPARSSLTIHPPMIGRKGILATRSSDLHDRAVRHARKGSRRMLISASLEHSALCAVQILNSCGTEGILSLG